MRLERNRNLLKWFHFHLTVLLRMPLHFSEYTRLIYTVCSWHAVKIQPENNLIFDP